MIRGVRRGLEVVALQLGMRRRDHASGREGDADSEGHRR